MISSGLTFNWIGVKPLSIPFTETVFQVCLVVFIATFPLPPVNKVAHKVVVIDTTINIIFFS